MLAPDGPAAGGLIQPIAMASAGMFGQMHLKGLKGSATYEGQAAGYYATRDAGSAEATSGRFTATAILEANFDAVYDDMPDDATSLDEAAGGLGLEPVAHIRSRVAQPGTAAILTTRYYRPTVLRPGVSFAGSKIDKFMAEDGSTMMEGWVVNLDGGVLRRPGDVAVVGTGTEPLGGVIEADLVTAYNKAIDAAEKAGTFNGTTSGTGGAHEWTGIWDASFHGTNTATLPTGVVGTFQAVSKDANGWSRPHPVTTSEGGAINLLTDPGFVGVVGSFGARR